MGRPKKVEPVSITFDEFQVQVALGILTKPSQMTPFIRVTTDIALIKWALHDKRKALQKAAIHNPSCPVVELMYAIMFLGAKTTKGYNRYYNETTCAELALKALHKKSKSELDTIFSMVKEYPQLSLFIKK